MFNFKSLITASAVGAVLAAAPASAAITTFASFSPIGEGSNLRWLNNGANGNQGTGGSIFSISSTGSTVLGTRLVSFSFLQPSLAPAVTGVSAIFQLSGVVPSGNPATQAGSFLVQDAVVGSFSFTSTSAVTVGTNFYAAGSNLLSATFSDAVISGQRNSTSASFGVSTSSGGTLVYSSDFLDFSNTIAQDFAISMSAVTGPVQAFPFAAEPTRALRSFRAVAGGSFASDPAPIVNGVPEPEMWGLMVVGFGMVGLQVRRRARQASIAA